MTQPEEQHTPPTAEELMRGRLTGHDADQCGAPLHGDDRWHCLALPHGDDQTHLTEIDDPELGVERQLIQWSEAPSESQTGRTDHGQESG